MFERLDEEGAGGDRLSRRLKGRILRFHQTLLTFSFSVYRMLSASTSASVSEADIRHQALTLVAETRASPPSPSMKAVGLRQHSGATFLIDARYVLVRPMTCSIYIVVMIFIIMIGRKNYPRAGNRGYALMSTSPELAQCPNFTSPRFHRVNTMALLSTSPLPLLPSGPPAGYGWEERDMSVSRLLG